MFTLKCIAIKTFFKFKCIFFYINSVLDRKVISLHTLLLLVITFYFPGHNICAALITLYNIKMVSNKPNIYFMF